MTSQNHLQTKNLTTLPGTGVTGVFYMTTPTGGMAQSGTFTVYLAPTISSFTPTSGAAGTLVTINGTNFAGITSVKFGGVAASSFTVVSTAKITVTGPNGAATGTISVTNPAGTVISAGTFTYTGPRPAAATALPTAPLTVALFPNPAREEWVELLVENLPTPSAALEMRDGLGRLVRTVEVGAGATRLPLTDLPKGIYLRRLDHWQQRLIVE